MRKYIAVVVLGFLLLGFGFVWGTRHRDTTVRNVPNVSNIPELLPSKTDSVTSPLLANIETRKLYEVVTTPAGERR